MVFYTKNVTLIRQKIIDVHLKLIGYLVKPANFLYTCECREDSLKKGYFTNRIEKIYVLVYKRIVGVKKVLVT